MDLIAFKWIDTFGKQLIERIAVMNASSKMLSASISEKKDNIQLIPGVYIILNYSRTLDSELDSEFSTIFHNFSTIFNNCGKIQLFEIEKKKSPLWMNSNHNYLCELYSLLVRI